MKREYLRYLKSKNTFILSFVLIITGIIGFLESYFDKAQFAEQLNYPAPDLDMGKLKNLVATYSGSQFLQNFWYLSDLSIVYIIALFLGIGIFLSATPLIQKDNGFGNFIMTRTSYKKYIKNILFAQTLYIITINFIVMVILYIIAIIMGGGISDLQVGFHHFNAFEGFLLNILQFVLVTIYAILVNTISLLMFNTIKNKYVLQAFPILAFFVLPIIIRGSIYNVWESFRFVRYFDPQEITGCITTYLSTLNSNYTDVLWYTLPFALFIIIAIVLYIKNLKKYTENYI